ncbi:site-2 protease family protein [Pseudonocardiaceae bacterium YIM PH 21723]|nr:site-2 protease family protein [Pseudonocardiaceae bacterium YIM PH 21723]
MSDGIRLGRYQGVPILLAHSWWLGAAVIVALYTPIVQRLLPGASLQLAAALAVAFAVLLGASVLLHELGHCVVALRLGLGVRRVRLFLLGGISEVTGVARRPAQEGWVAVAGPLVSLALAVLGGAGLMVLPERTPLWFLVAELAAANGAVAVFNLLPGLPLDGGRLLRALAWGVTGKRRLGTLLGVGGAGLVAAGLIAWAAIGLGNGSPDKWLRLGVCVLLAWFLIVGAGQELTTERRRVLPDGVRLLDFAVPVVQLPAELPLSDAVAAAMGRGVLLMRADGVAAGLLDEDRARRLLAEAPGAPAELAASPVSPEHVLLESEDGQELVDRVLETPAWHFLVVDEEGRPTAVLHRSAVHAALGR